MGSAYKILPHYTFEDWSAWEGKWELIEGIPYAMSPAPMPKHQRIASELNTEFGLALRKSHCKHCRLYHPIDFKISDDTILQPDLLIVCGEITKSFLDFPPVLVAEILSPAIALKDRDTKFYLYEQQRIKYYLIIDTEKQTVEIYELLNNKYQLTDASANSSFSFTDNCDISINLADLWN